MLTVELSDAVFEEIARLIHRLCGITLHEGKVQLVRARLNKRLRALKLRDFREYLDYLRGDGGRTEVTALLDAISTNLTSFFREPDHFQHLGEVILPRLAAGGSRRLRIWSAGCSSGEEPYSIAITVRESLPDIPSWDARVLATDISTRMLTTARAAVYDAARIQPVSPMVRSRSFTCVESRPQKRYRVLPTVRKLVHFARLNLMESWPMAGPFDVVFCRNVMIYFDRPTRERLIGRFHDLLAKGGTLFVGHSESLTGIRHGFTYVRPTVYQKP
jgi:chemotaxis protein methyltransferase CheR